MLAGCSSREQAAAQSGGGGGGPAPVTVATVEKQDVPVEIRSIATGEAFATVTIRSRVSGQLQKVHVAPGQDVKKGDPLFEIDPRPFEIAMHEAEARMERDNALANNARIDSERTNGLLQNNAATQEEADKAKFAAEAALATVRADQAMIDNAKLQIQYATITSPVDGRTGSLLADIGNVVKADDTQLLVINQIHPIYVTFAIPEQDLEQVRKYDKPGNPPEIDVAVPPSKESSEKGKLSFVDNAVDTQTGTIRLKGTFENEDRNLWPGQFLQATLKLTVEKGLTVVPSRAVQPGQQGQFVFVVKDDLTVDMKPVTVRRTLGDMSILDTGPEPGQRVVTDGQLRLVPGAKVSIQKPGSTSQPTTQETQL